MKNSFTTRRWSFGEPEPNWSKKESEYYKKKRKKINKVVPIPFRRPNSKLTVYVLRSRNKPEIVKIGYTIKTVEKRLKSINLENSFYKSLDFELELKFKGGGQSAEQQAHRMLRELGRHVQGETFICSKEEIKTLFSNYLK